MSTIMGSHAFRKMYKFLLLLVQAFPDEFDRGLLYLLTLASLKPEFHGLA